MHQRGHNRRVGADACVRPIRRLGAGLLTIPACQPKRRLSSPPSRSTSHANRHCLVIGRHHKRVVGKPHTLAVPAHQISAAATPASGHASGPASGPASALSPTVVAVEPASVAQPTAWPTRAAATADAPRKRVFTIVCPWGLENAQLPGRLQDPCTDLWKESLSSVLRERCACESPTESRGLATGDRLSGPSCGSGDGGPRGQSDWPLPIGSVPLTMQVTPTAELAKTLPGGVACEHDQTGWRQVLAGIGCA